MGCLLIGLLWAHAATAAGLRWHRPVRLESASLGGVQAVSCPTSQLCVAVDAAGNVLFSTHPTRGAGSWSHPARIDGNELTGISCPTIHLCVAVDGNGNVVTSTAPTRGSKGWRRPVRVDSAASPDGGLAGLLGVSCPTTTLCVAVDGALNGAVVTSTRPAGGGRAWRIARLGAPLASVSCSSARLCLAAGPEHFVSSVPTGGRQSWVDTGGPVDGGVLDSIDCPRASLCLGVGAGNDSPGIANVTSSPRGSGRTWQTFDVVPSPPPFNAEPLDAVSCAGTALCVTLDTSDQAYVTGTPLRGGWRGPFAIRPNSGADQNAVSCTPHLCVVVDSAGVESTGIVS